MTPLQHNVPGC